MWSIKRLPTHQNNRARLRCERLEDRAVPAFLLTWKATPTDNDITKAYNYDTLTIDPAGQDLKFTGTTSKQPTLLSNASLTVKTLKTESTWAGTIFLLSGATLTTYGSTIDGTGSAPLVMSGSGTLQLGREADDGSVHDWVNGRARVGSLYVGGTGLYVGGTGGGTSARLMIQSGFDEIGLEGLSSFKIGYIGTTAATAEVQLKGGTTTITCDNVDVSATGMITALARTTWEDPAAESTATAFVVSNGGLVSIGQSVAFELSKGRYTDANGATGIPMLKIKRSGTFKTTLTDTTYPATSPGVLISKGYVDMFDGSGINSIDRDVVVENDSRVFLKGGGRWYHEDLAGQSRFYISAGSPTNVKTFRLKDNARLEFKDDDGDGWYDGAHPVTQCGSELHIGGNFIHGDTSTIKARGQHNNVYDQLMIAGMNTTTTIGGNAKVEVVLKGPPPAVGYNFTQWDNFIFANDLSAASPPYDPGDLSTDGAWGAGWTPSSELFGLNRVRLKFVR